MEKAAGFFHQVRKRRRSFVKKKGKRLIRALGDYMGRQSLVGDVPVFDAARFPWVAGLESNWAAIRAELDSVLTVRELVPSFHEISPDQKRISKGDNWKTFILYGFGFKSENNCLTCPETVRVLETIDGLQTAWFSILAPGYHIPAHRGVTKGVIRCHLGLKVPERSEDCVMRVDQERCQWQEGKCLVFDDTYEHEIWNNTDEERVVLLLDVDRPMRLPGRLLNKALVSGMRWTAYFQDARKNLVAWDQRFERAVRRADGYHVEADK